jgi:hypothetical protein
VTIGFGTRDEIAGDRAVGARPVFDDHRLPEGSRQGLREDARHHVGGPAGRETHQQADRLARLRKRLREGGVRPRGIRLVGALADLVSPQLIG